MNAPSDGMTRIVLVRHGQTEWNRIERFRGRIDVPLNEEGHRQAQAVARRLFSWRIDGVYSSPLARAVQTAQPIGETCGRSVSLLEGITDVDYGSWAGLSPEEAASQHPELFETWVENPQLIHFPGGESLEQVESRALAALEEVCSTHSGKSIALVSHVVVNRVLICGALGLGSRFFWRIGQDNAALSVLEYLDGEYRLHLLNDTCHLDSLPQGMEPSSTDAARSP
jgi:broad specificity phosphatase PhoE